MLVAAGPFLHALIVLLLAVGARVGEEAGPECLWLFRLDKDGSAPKFTAIKCFSFPSRWMRIDACQTYSCCMLIILIVL